MPKLSVLKEYTSYGTSMELLLLFLSFFFVADILNFCTEETQQRKPPKKSNIIGNVAMLKPNHSTFRFYHVKPEKAV